MRHDTGGSLRIWMHCEQAVCMYQLKRARSSTRRRGAALTRDRRRHERGEPPATRLHVLQGAKLPPGVKRRTRFSTMPRYFFASASSTPPRGARPFHERQELVENNGCARASPRADGLASTAKTPSSRSRSFSTSSRRSPKRASPVAEWTTPEAKKYSSASPREAGANASHRNALAASLLAGHEAAWCAGRAAICARGRNDCASGDRAPRRRVGTAPGSTSCPRVAPGWGARLAVHANGFCSRRIQADPVELAADIMSWERIRHLPVEDENGKFLGVVTSRAVLRHFARRIGVATESQSVLPREPDLPVDVAHCRDCPQRQRRKRQPAAASVQHHVRGHHAHGSRDDLAGYVDPRSDQTDAWASHRRLASRQRWPHRCNGDGGGLHGHCRRPPRRKDSQLMMLPLSSPSVPHHPDWTSPHLAERSADVPTGSRHRLKSSASTPVRR